MEITFTIPDAVQVGKSLVGVIESVYMTLSIDLTVKVYI